MASKKKIQEYTEVQDHGFKNQTPEHKAAMKRLIKDIQDETGCSLDDIIDCGDYILDQTTLEEMLTGKKDENKQADDKQADESKPKKSKKSKKDKRAKKDKKKKSK